MPASRARGGGLAGVLKKVLLGFLIAGVVLALLRIFNYDVFGIVDWIFSWITHIIERIADFFTGNKNFRDVTDKPS